MNEIEIVKFQVETTVSTLQSNILRYYNVLHELKRMSLFLLNETACERRDIEKWFEDDAFDICEDGFWQSISALKNHRQGNLSNQAISYSCHPDLRLDNDACFQMYCHRNMGEYLSDIRLRLHGSAWIYYQGACNVALQYPFIDQATAIAPDFDWSTYHTWISVCPANNPDREIKWTAPSIDYAGEGLIISVSIPVYRKDKFLGLWSIDLPMETLYHDYIYEKQIPEQQNFIADYDANIIVHPIIETKIDNEKGSIYREKIGSIGKGFEKINLANLISKKEGQIEVFLKNNRMYDVFYKIIPEIDWIYFSIFPKDRMMDVINNKVKAALDKVRGGDYSFRVQNIPENVSNNVLVKSFNEMAEAIEMQHQQLLASQKRVVQAEKLSAIGTLAGGIAHDFNNILSSIIGFTELSLDEVEQESPTADNLQEVYAAGIRAKELVGQILAFARQTDEKPKPIRLDSIVKEVLKLLRSSIPSTIEIKSDIESRSYIYGDSINIHQILMNLCTNAAQAMEKGGELTVSLKDGEIAAPNPLTSEHLSVGHYLKLTVADTGTGIPDDIIESIFEPYFTTKSLGQGTGMGLAMVHGIVKKYKGEITVKSEIGKGTRFSVYFPTTEDESEMPSYKSEKLPVGNERVLFVDDELSIASMGSQMLNRLGYKVTARTDSKEALDLFRNRKNDFGLVITDMTMPNMAGSQPATEILRIRPEIPIILCTGYNEKISDESAAEIGIKAFAYKPVVKADLAKTVRKVLDEAKGSTQA